MTKNGQQVEINSRIQENDQEHPYLLELDDTLSNPGNFVFVYFKRDLNFKNCLLENEILKVLEKGKPYNFKLLI